jgi:hypothetical protein
VAIAQDDQLDNEFIVRRDVKGQDKGGRQAALIEISIDVGGDNKVFVVLNDFRNCDRQSFADDVSLGPVPMAAFPQ